MAEGCLGAAAGRIDRVGMPVDDVLVERVFRMKPARLAIEPPSVGFVFCEQGLGRTIALELVAAERRVLRKEPAFAIKRDRGLLPISFAAAAPRPGVAEP